MVSEFMYLKWDYIHTYYVPIHTRIMVSTYKLKFPEMFLLKLTHWPKKSIFNLVQRFVNETKMGAQVIYVGTLLDCI